MRNGGAHSGFLLLEVLIGITLFGLFLFAVTSSMLYGQENTIRGGHRARAVYLAESTLVTARSVRNASFASLTSGVHGIDIDDTTGKLMLSGSYAVTTGGYISALSITPRGTDWLAMSGTTKWQFGATRSGSVVIDTELTNWRTTKTVGNWSSISVEGSVMQGGGPVFSGVAVAGNYAYVGGGGGDGLYIYDISSLTSPTRVNSSFNPGYNVYALGVYGDVLYVVTSDANAEIKALDISNPLANPLPTIDEYNLPGSGIAQGMALYGTGLLVTANQDSGSGLHELYYFSITGPTNIDLKMSINDLNGGHIGVGRSGSSAYVASSNDGGELRTITVSATGGISFDGAGTQVSGTEDGMSIATTGTYALLGRGSGSSIQEIVMFNIRNGGEPSGDGPYFHETKGKVVGLAAEPSGCYGFAAVEQKWKALQIFEIQDTSLSEKAYYTLVSDTSGRGLLYDMVRDRVFFISDDTLYIFKPASATGTC